MLYSANHCIALASLYEEQFGQPIPESTAKAAARSGMYQQMMHDIDQAISNKRPIKDWSSYLGGCPKER